MGVVQAWVGQKVIFVPTVTYNNLATSQEESHNTTLPAKQRNHGG
jgi:hypothetical protein